MKRISVWKGLFLTAGFRRFTQVFIYYAAVLLLFMQSSCIFGQIPVPVQRHVEKLHIHDKIILPYLFYMPREYFSGRYEKRPLVLFLHGKGERGKDLNLLKRQGLPKMIAAGSDFPFFMISPQITEDKNEWPLDAVHDIVMKIADEYPVDRSRIYITGISMGGFGTWELGAKFPNTFAAAAPICGWGSASKVCRMKNIPVWTFHNQGDAVVPVKDTLDIAQRLELCGGNVRKTVYPKNSHDAWTETYQNPAFMEWLLSQKKKKQETENGNGFSSSNPLKVLAVGDSLGVSFVWSFNEKFNKNHNIVFLNRSKVSSGLCHIQFYNWPAELEKILEKEKFHAGIVFMGANDTQSLLKEDGKSVPFRTDEWKKIYKERVLKMADVFERHNLKVYWYGLPPMEPKRYHSEAMFVTARIEEASQESGKFLFIPSTFVLGDKKGNFTKTMHLSGRNEIIRADDGIHLSFTAANMLRDRLLQEIYKDFYFVE